MAYRIKFKEEILTFDFILNSITYFQVFFILMRLLFQKPQGKQDNLFKDSLLQYNCYQLINFQMKACLHFFDF